MAVTSRGRRCGWERLLPGNVYIVDDDASLRTALKRLLSNAGYDVETYSSAQDLLERLPDETRPGCILSDVRMPGLSGPDLQTLLNQRGSTLPIIFLTGHADVRTTVQTVKAGAHDFLMKPVPADELLPAINRALERHESSWAAKTAIDRLARARGEADAARAAGFRTRHPRQDQQAYRARIGIDRTHGRRHTVRRSWKRPRHNPLQNWFRWPSGSECSIRDELRARS